MPSARPTSPVSTADLVARYAEGFDGRFASDHAVTSPFGAWVLLALAGPLTEGDRRARLERAIGCDVDDAAARARELLATPHPAVAAAAAVWARIELLVAERFDAFADGLGDAVEQGPMPDQQGADRWASEHTLGLIDRFPLELDDVTALVLATAVATKVSWTVPFAEVAADGLGGWFATPGVAALLAPHEHRQLIVETSAAGLVAAHVASSANGLDVVSVLADPSTQVRDAHAAAQEVAALISGRATGAQQRSLFDLPLGDGPAWTLTESREARFGGPSRVETFATHLPAWSARSMHHIGAAPGFGDVMHALAGLLRPEAGPPSFDAVQAAMAEYTRVGFEAAAVTAVAMRAAGVPREVQAVIRRAEVTFDRPYAVVAVASGSAPRHASPPSPPVWAGVPVFSAWVARPVRG